MTKRSGSKGTIQNLLLQGPAIVSMSGRSGTYHPRATASCLADIGKALTGLPVIESLYICKLDHDALQAENQAATGTGRTAA
jgi:hypothetical protein